LRSATLTVDGSRKSSRPLILHGALRRQPLARKLKSVTRITSPSGRSWDAPDPEGAELLRVALGVSRTPEAANGLRAALAEHDLALDDGNVGWSVTAALRTALAIICARLLRDESRAAETLARRDRLYELDRLLQTVLAPRRRGQYATFPSRRHMRQFEQMGFPVEEVARVIGMPLDEAQAHVAKLGLRRVRTSYMLMDRAPGDLDVVADDGAVTMILGLHM
jgi:hypothetical protein